MSGYDIMASALVLKEAGGFLTDIEGKNLSHDVKASGLSIIGTKNKEMQERIVGVLASFKNNL